MSIAIAPCEMAADAPTCLTTTLYDLMAALHDVVTPHEDALVVALVAHWLRTGRIMFRGEAGSHPMTRRYGCRGGVHGGGRH
jgi:hypothetical protein